MKVHIRKIAEKEKEQVFIDCVEITPEIKDICAYIRAKGTNLTGISDGKICQFQLEEVFYFEALDEKVFAYTKSQIYEMKVRLYEVEEAYRIYQFIRCSKSIVLNLMLLEGISPALNGRFFAHMRNGEKIIISRQYVPLLKQAVMGEQNVTGKTGKSDKKTPTKEPDKWKLSVRKNRKGRTEMRKGNPFWKELLISFMVCTTCICIAEGVLGIIFMPEEKFGYEAFLSPPIFGFLSVILGLVAESRRELSMGEVIVRKIIHLLLIEGLVFGLNYAAGSEFPVGLQLALAATIAGIYIVVHVVLYINDRKSADDFNRHLEDFQKNCREEVE